MSKRRKRKRPADEHRRREKAPEMLLVVEADPPARNLPLLVTSIGLLLPWAVFLLITAVVQ